MTKLGIGFAVVSLAFFAACVLFKDHRFFHHGYGYCLKCQVSWTKETRKHTTFYEFNEKGEGTHGYFPLCERCWHKLEHPAERLPYYWRAVRDRGIGRDAEWPKIQEAVLLGK